MTREYTSAGWRDDDAKLASIYGVTVDTDKPITGVISNGSIAWLGDLIADGIDIGWEDALEEYRATHDGEDPDCDETDGWESNGPYLVGDWTKGDDGLWEPDHDGEQGFSAIVGETTTQVVWSETTTRAHHCSPCYPGQADIGTDGDLLAYTLPADCFDDE